MGIFLHAVGNKTISAGHAKTRAFVGENRKLDARFGVKRFSRMRGNERIHSNGAITEHSSGFCCNCVSNVGFSGDGCLEGIFEVRTVKTRHLRGTS